jgi:hypothetical protein
MTNVRQDRRRNSFQLPTPPVVKGEPQSSLGFWWSFASLQLLKATFELRVKTTARKPGFDSSERKPMNLEILRGEYIPIHGRVKTFLAEIWSQIQKIDPSATLMFLAPSDQTQKEGVTYMTPS